MLLVVCRCLLVIPVVGWLYRVKVCCRYVLLSFACSRWRCLLFGVVCYCCMLCSCLLCRCLLFATWYCLVFVVRCYSLLFCCCVLWFDVVGVVSCMFVGCRMSSCGV